MTNPPSGGYSDRDSGYGSQPDSYGWRDPNSPFADQGGSEPTGYLDESEQDEGPREYTLESNTYAEPHTAYGPPQSGIPAYGPPTSPAGPRPQPQAAGQPGGWQQPQQQQKSSVGLFVVLGVAVVLFVAVGLGAVVLLNGGGDDGGGGGGDDGGGGETVAADESPTEVVEGYYSGMEDNDPDALSDYVCADWQDFYGNITDDEWQENWDLVNVSTYEVTDETIVQEQSEAEVTVLHSTSGMSADIGVGLTWESDSWKICDWDLPAEGDYS